MIYLGDFDVEHLSRLTNQAVPSSTGEDLANLERMAAQVLRNLSRPGKRKAAAEGIKTLAAVPEKCHAYGALVDQGDLRGLIHQACHTLTGKCVDVELTDLVNKVGECVRVGDRFTVIRIADNMSFDATVRTALHEVGHVKSWLIGRSESEPAADFWAAYWLDKGETLARMRFGKSDALRVLRALAEK